MNASRLIEIISTSDSRLRDTSLDSVCREASLEELLSACARLDAFWRQNDNLYQRVRALFFLYAIHRFHVPPKLSTAVSGSVPYDGFRHLLKRRFEESIDLFLRAQSAAGQCLHTV